MSPEQAWGRNIDRRSDIFALAIVLFEMLTGRKLFTGENEMSVLEQVREAKVIAPSQVNDEVTPEIDSIVLKALQKDPANRYQTAAEMARDLDAVLYNWKPTPTSADLAIFMHRQQAAQPIAAPVPVAQPAPPPVAEPKTTPPAVGPMPAWNASHATAQPRKVPIVPIAIAAVVVIVVGTGVWAMRSRTGSASAAPQRPAVANASAPVTTKPAQAPTESAAAVVPAASTQAPVPDAAKVDEEVRKRLAAEKAKLEEQARAQQAIPQPRLPLLTRSAQPPVQLQAQQTQTAAPPPVVENRPLPVPLETVAQPQPQPVAPAPVPVPVPATLEAPRVREGDLVPTGTDGLVVARMIHRGAVPYPPLAKMQRVQGTVLISVLVSENGQVLETRLVRGVDRPVGLNEAADQIVRRSTFSPPTKDGVRVKAWTTVPVDFKL
jgi:serine/threonine-protein kinase